MSLHVSGTKLLDANGQPAKLRGVNICSLEWTAPGDHLLQSISVAIDQWHANIIRLPLSQDRWFGKTADSPNGGADYRALVKEAVSQISSRNAYAILDLHWSDCGEWGQNIGQHKLPDRDSIEFWKSCAATYANDPAVIFDLYNEPYGADWSVWHDGGSVTEQIQGKPVTYQAVGLQTLLDTIRSTGAKNVVHCGGLGYSSQLDYPNSALLRDRTGNGVVYVSHFYPGWENVPSWQARIERAAATLPVFVEEFGDDTPSAPMDTPTRRVGQVLAVLKKDDFNWTAWCMHPAAHPCLITDWDYHVTPEFGALVKDALAGKDVAIAPRKTHAPDFTAFDGKFEDQWASWSSAKIDLNSEPGHQSAHAVQAELGPNQQVQFGAVPFDGLAYRGISFWIKSAPGKTSNLTLAAGIMDHGQPPVGLPPIGDQWTKVEVDFDRLGIAGKEDIKSFMIRNQDGSATSQFAIDELRILGK